MTFVSLIEGPPAGLTLLAYARMNAASGTSETDASGNGHTGTYSGTGVTLNATGALSGSSDKAATFDGVSGQLAIPVNLSTQNKLTVLMWVKYNGSWPVSPTTNYLLSYGGQQVAGSFVITAVTSLNVYMGTSGFEAGVQTAALSTGSYHLLAVTFDRSQSTSIAQYGVMVDGAPVAISSISGHTAVVGSNFANLSPLVVAATSTATNFAPITVDEFALFSGVMTAAQFSQLYASSKQQLVSSSYAQAPRQPWRLPVTGAVAATPTEGAMASYVWTKTLPAGSSAALVGAGTPSVSLTPDVEGSYGLSCVATDAGGNFAALSGSTNVVAPKRVLQSGVWVPAETEIYTGSAWF